MGCIALNCLGVAWDCGHEHGEGSCHSYLKCLATCGPYSHVDTECVYDCQREEHKSSLLDQYIQCID